MMGAVDLGPPLPHTPKFVGRHRLRRLSAPADDEDRFRHASASFFNGWGHALEMQMSDIGVLGLRKRFHFNETNALMSSVVQARQRLDVQEVEKRIVADPRFQALIGKLIACGDAGGSVNEFHLSSWWTWRANEVGPETANAELEKFLAADEVESLVCVWLFGDFVQEITEVIDGVELWPLSKLPFSWEKIEFANHVAGPLGHIMPAPQAALVQKVRRSKTYTFPDDMPSPNVGHRLNCLALLLNLLPNVKVSACCTCSYTADDWPPGVWGGSGSSSPVSDVIMDRGDIFRNDQDIDIGKLLDAYMGRSDQQRAALHVALQRIQNAKGRMHNPENVALDLGIALERLLLENSNADQLSLSFRLRGAWLIGSGDDDRIATYKVLNEIYKIRSEVAHFGTSKRLKDIAPYQNYLAPHIRVAERIARKIVLEGTPDWEKLLLGMGR